MGRFMRETSLVGICLVPTLSQRGQKTFRKTVLSPLPDFFGGGHHSDPRAQACSRLNRPAATTAPSCCLASDTWRLLVCSTTDGEWRSRASARGPGKCTSCLQVGFPFQQEAGQSDCITPIPGNSQATRINGPNQKIRVKSREWNLSLPLHLAHTPGFFMHHLKAARLTGS